MKLSSRVKGAIESITLKVNEKVFVLSQSGKRTFNMTAGQLPFKPTKIFIESIKKELNFLSSYQYSPIKGFKELREKFLQHSFNKRKVETPENFDCIVSNGSKHSLYNLLGAIIDPGDEVILFIPYWVSYPEMIKFWGGTFQSIKTHSFDGYTPQIEDLELLVSSKTKAIIVNSPNNPSGNHYSSEWMKSFAHFLKNHPDLIVISDEIYSRISYFDPKPTYFYQYDRSLLSQTVIVDGISKSLASTGLRIGYTLGPKEIIDAMGKIQSQTTSGASSLVQRALIDFDFDSLDDFYSPIESHIRECAQILREEFRMGGLSHCWYQTTSGFYFMLDFSRTPIFEQKYKTDNGDDLSDEICQDILDQTGVAIVPGKDFGYPNSARISMTLDLAPFKEGIQYLVAFLNNSLK